MRKSFLLAGSNLRRAKGQTAAIFVLVVLAASMLNLWLMLSMDYKQNFDRCHERLHAEHVTLAVDEDSGEMRDFLSGMLEKDGRTAEFSLDDVMKMIGLFQYNGGEINTELVFFEKQAAISRQVGRAEIVKDSDIRSGIYMPMLYESDEIAVGKEIEISIGSNKMTYTVCGFFNSVMAGSHNCSMCEMLLTEDKYHELEETGYAPRATMCSVRLTEKSESEDFETMLKNEVSSRYPGVRTVSNSYALVSQSRYISQMIGSGILSAMAFFILVIALVVIASNIANYIRENMKSLGALKAVGYTGSQLICSLVLQFTGLSVAAAAVGVCISYGLFPAVNAMMTSQTGIPYIIRFLPLPFLATLVILCGSVALVAGRSSRRIKKTEPITALRQGVLTHNFRRNHVPLEKTKVPITPALALKTTFSGMKQNVTLCITMVVLSLVVVFSGVMIRNVITDREPFLNLIVGETADSCINVSAETEKEFLQEVHADRRVEKVYLYHSAEVRHVGGIGLMATICDDFSKVNN